MEIAIEKISDGKPTKIRESKYLSTNEYVGPFIELMNKFTKDIRINVQLPSQITFTDNTEDITYNRVWVQAIMPEKFDKDGYAETFNLVFGLDIKQPVYKVFKAYMDRVSKNIYVFDSRWLYVYELKPLTKFIDFKDVIINLMGMNDDAGLKIQKLKSVFLSSLPEDKQKNLGEWIEKSMYFEYKHKGGKIKISPSLVWNTYQSIYMDSSSKYYVPEAEQCSLFNALDAFSAQVNDPKDLLTRFEKIKICTDILNDEICN